MATGRAHPSLVMDVQVLVTHAASIAIMEREMGTRRGSPAGRTCVTISRRAMPSACRDWWTAGSPMALRRKSSSSLPGVGHYPTIVFPRHDLAMA
jgi:hypothetical protein